MKERVRLAIVIPSLDAGGAERQMAMLLSRIDRTRFEPAVFCIYTAGDFAPDVAAAGIDVVALAKGRTWRVLPFLVRLISALKRFGPDVIYSLLPEPNVLSTLAWFFLRRAALVWGVRSAYGDAKREGLAFRFYLAMERRLSRLPAAIIANSDAARALCVARGYADARLMTIPNGVDVERFHPDSAMRERIRAELGLGTAPVIGIVGRLEPVKDHETFIRAAAALHASRPDVRFLIVGRGTDARVAALRNLADSLHVGDAILWTGARSDVAAVMNACDLIAVTSIYESSPNVILEAMACGVPCVTTDAGDARLMVGESGVVTGDHAPETIAAAWSAMLDRLRVEGDALRSAARHRIVERYGSESMVSRTEEALEAASRRE